MNATTYRGPRVTARSGRGRGSWIWVTPGLADPGPDELRRMGDAMAESAHRSVLSEYGATEKAIDEVDRLFEAVAHVDSRPGYDEFYSDPDEGGETDLFAEDVERETAVSTVPASAEVAAMPVAVNVLGPVEVLGWRIIPQRKVITELACYLALHPNRFVTGEELRAALWPESSSTIEAGAKSLRNYMSELRRSIGSDVVRSSRGSGYGLDPSVVSDWGRFVALSEGASGPDDEAHRLEDALGLVRGRPFTGVTYSWVYSELLVSEIEVAIAAVARRLAMHSATARDPDGVVFGLRRALLACPYDVTIWEFALQASARVGHEELARTWRDAQAALGDDAGELVELVHSLGGA